MIRKGSRLLGALFELGSLRQERLAPIEIGLAERAADLFQGEPELAAEQDLLQTQQIVIVVEPVAGVGASDRHQQLDLVVVMESPHRNAGDFGDLFDQVRTLASHDQSVMPHVA